MTKINDTTFAIESNTKGVVKLDEEEVKQDVLHVRTFRAPQAIVFTGDSVAQEATNVTIESYSLSGSLKSVAIGGTVVEAGSLDTTTYGADNVLNLNNVKISNVFGGAVTLNRKYALYANQYAWTTGSENPETVVAGDKNDTTKTVATINLNDATVTNVYGAGGGYGSYTYGNTEINFNGGKVGTIFGGAAKGGQFTGNVTITVAANANGSIKNIYAGGDNTTVNGAATVVFNTNNTGFSGTVYGTGKGTATVTGGSTLVFNGYNGDFRGTVKAFNLVQFTGDTTVNFTKGQDKSMANGAATYEFVIDADTLSTNSAILTWNKKATFANLAITIEDAALLDADNAYSVTLIASTYLKGDNAINFSNIKLNGEAVGTITVNGKTVREGNTGFALDYTWDKKTGGSLVLRYIGNDFSFDAAVDQDIKFNGNGQNIILEDGAEISKSLDLGDGDNSLDVQKGAVVTGDILAGNGDDTLTLAKGALVEGNIDLGEGDNRIDVAAGSEITGTITLAANSANDITVASAGAVESIVDEGCASATIRLNGDITGGGYGRWYTAEAYQEIMAGLTDKIKEMTLTEWLDAQQYKFNGEIFIPANLDLGNATGDISVYVNRFAAVGSIYLGSGNDYVEIANDSYFGKKYVAFGNSSFSTDDANNDVTATVDLGSGINTIVLKGGDNAAVDYYIKSNADAKNVAVIQDGAITIDADKFLTGSVNNALVLASGVKATFNGTTIGAFQDENNLGIFLSQNAVLTMGGADYIQDFKGIMNADGSDVVILPSANDVTGEAADIINKYYVSTGKGVESSMITADTIMVAQGGKVVNSTLNGTTKTDIYGTVENVSIAGGEATLYSGAALTGTGSKIAADIVVKDGASLADATLNGAVTLEKGATMTAATIKTDADVTLNGAVDATTKILAAGIVTLGSNDAKLTSIADADDVVFSKNYTNEALAIGLKEGAALSEIGKNVVVATLKIGDADFDSSVINLKDNHTFTAVDEMYTIVDALHGNFKATAGYTVELRPCDGTVTWKGEEYENVAVFGDATFSGNDVIVNAGEGNLVSPIAGDISGKASFKLASGIVYFDYDQVKNAELDYTVQTGAGLAFDGVIADDEKAALRDKVTLANNAFFGIGTEANVKDWKGELDLQADIFDKFNNLLAFNELQPFTELFVNNGGKITGYITATADADKVTLGENVTVNGSRAKYDFGTISMGEDDDTLTLSKGVVVNGAIDMGTGDDTLVLLGATVNTAINQKATSVILNGGTVDVKEGVNAVNGNIDLADNGGKIAIAEGAELTVKDILTASGDVELDIAGKLAIADATLDIAANGEALATIYNTADISAAEIELKGDAKAAIVVEDGAKVAQKLTAKSGNGAAAIELNANVEATGDIAAVGDTAAVTIGKDAKVTNDSISIDGANEATLVNLGTIDPAIELRGSKNTIDNFGAISGDILMDKDANAADDVIEGDGATNLIENHGAITADAIQMYGDTNTLTTNATKNQAAGTLTANSIIMAGKSTFTPATLHDDAKTVVDAAAGFNTIAGTLEITGAGDALVMKGDGNAVNSDLADEKVTVAGNVELDATAESNTIGGTLDATGNLTMTAEKANNLNNATVGGDMTLTADKNNMSTATVAGAAKLVATGTNTVTPSGSVTANVIGSLTAKSVEVTAVKGGNDIQDAVKATEGELKVTGTSNVIAKAEAADKATIVATANANIITDLAAKSAEINAATTNTIAKAAIEGDAEITAATANTVTDITAANVTMNVTAAGTDTANTITGNVNLTGNLDMTGAAKNIIETNRSTSIVAAAIDMQGAVNIIGDYDAAGAVEMDTVELKRTSIDDAVTVKNVGDIADSVKADSITMEGTDATNGLILGIVATANGEYETGLHDHAEINIGNIDKTVEADIAMTGKNNVILTGIGLEADGEAQITAGDVTIATKGDVAMKGEENQMTMAVELDADTQSTIDTGKIAISHTGNVTMATNGNSGEINSFSIATDIDDKSYLDQTDEAYSKVTAGDVSVVLNGNIAMGGAEAMNKVTLGEKAVVNGSIAMGDTDADKFSKQNTLEFNLGSSENVGDITMLARTNIINLSGNGEIKNDLEIYGETNELTIGEETTVGSIGTAEDVIKFNNYYDHDGDGVDNGDEQLTNTANTVKVYGKVNGNINLGAKQTDGDFMATNDTIQVGAIKKADGSDIDASVIPEGGRVVAAEVTGAISTGDTQENGTDSVKIYGSKVGGAITMGVLPAEGKGNASNTNTLDAYGAAIGGDITMTAGKANTATLAGITDQAGAVVATTSAQNIAQTAGAANELTVSDAAVLDIAQTAGTANTLTVTAATAGTIDMDAKTFNKLDATDATVGAIDMDAVQYNAATMANVTTGDIDMDADTLYNSLNIKTAETVGAVTMTAGEGNDLDISNAGTVGTVTMDAGEGNDLDISNAGTVGAIDMDATAGNSLDIATAETVDTIDMDAETAGNDLNIKDAKTVGTIDMTAAVYNYASVKNAATGDIAQNATELDNTIKLDLDPVNVGKLTQTAGRDNLIASLNDDAAVVKDADGNATGVNTSATGAISQTAGRDNTVDLTLTNIAGAIEQTAGQNNTLNVIGKELKNKNNEITSIASVKVDGDVTQNAQGANSAYFAGTEVTGNIAQTAKAGANSLVFDSGETTATAEKNSETVFSSFSGNIVQTAEAGDNTVKLDQVNVKSDKIEQTTKAGANTLVADGDNIANVGSIVVDSKNATIEAPITQKATAGNKVDMEMVDLTGAIQQTTDAGENNVSVTGNVISAVATADGIEKVNASTIAGSISQANGTGYNKITLKNVDVTADEIKQTTDAVQDAHDYANTLNLEGELIDGTNRVVDVRNADINVKSIVQTATNASNTVAIAQADVAGDITLTAKTDNRVTISGGATDYVAATADAAGTDSKVVESTVVGKISTTSAEGGNAVNVTMGNVEGGIAMKTDGGDNNSNELTVMGAVETASAYNANPVADGASAGAVRYNKSVVLANIGKAGLENAIEMNAANGANNTANLQNVQIDGNVTMTAVKGNNTLKANVGHALKRATASNSEAAYTGLRNDQLMDAVALKKDADGNDTSESTLSDFARQDIVQSVVNGSVSQTAGDLKANNIQMNDVEVTGDVTQTAGKAGTNSLELNGQLLSGINLTEDIAADKATKFQEGLTAEQLLEYSTVKAERAFITGKVTQTSTNELTKTPDSNTASNTVALGVVTTVGGGIAQTAYDSNLITATVEGEYKYGDKIEDATSKIVGNVTQSTMAVNDIQVSGNRTDKLGTLVIKSGSISQSYALSGRRDIDGNADMGIAKLSAGSSMDNLETKADEIEIAYNVQANTVTVSAATLSMDASYGITQGGDYATFTLGTDSKAALQDNLFVYNGTLFERTTAAETGKSTFKYATEGYVEGTPAISGTVGVLVTQTNDITVNGRLFTGDIAQTGLVNTITGINTALSGMDTPVAAISATGIAQNGRENYIFTSSADLVVGTYDSLTYEKALDGNYTLRNLEGFQGGAITQGDLAKEDGENDDLERDAHLYAASNIIEAGGDDMVMVGDITQVAGAKSTAYHYSTKATGEPIWVSDDIETSNFIQIAGYTQPEQGVKTLGNTDTYTYGDGRVVSKTTGNTVYVAAELKKAQVGSISQTSKDGSNTITLNTTDVKGGITMNAESVTTGQDYDGIAVRGNDANGNSTINNSDNHLVIYGATQDAVELEDVNGEIWKVYLGEQVAKSTVAGDVNMTAKNGYNNAALTGADVAGVIRMTATNVAKSEADALAGITNTLAVNALYTESYDQITNPIFVKYADIKLTDEENQAIDDDASIVDKDAAKAAKLEEKAKQFVIDNYLSDGTIHMDDKNRLVRTTADGETVLYADSTPVMNTLGGIEATAYSYNLVDLNDVKVAGGIAMTSTEAYNELVVKGEANVAGKALEIGFTYVTNDHGTASAKATVTQDGLATASTGDEYYSSIDGDITMTVVNASKEITEPTAENSDTSNLAELTNTNVGGNITMTAVNGNYLMLASTSAAELVNNDVAFYDVTVKGDVTMTSTTEANAGAANQEANRLIADDTNFGGDITLTAEDNGNYASINTNSSRIFDLGNGKKAFQATEIAGNITLTSKDFGGVKNDANALDDTAYLELNMVNVGGKITLDAAGKADDATDGSTSRLSINGRKNQQFSVDSETGEITFFNTKVGDIEMKGGAHAVVDASDVAYGTELVAESTDTGAITMTTDSGVNSIEFNAYKTQAYEITDGDFAGTKKANKNTIASIAMTANDADGVKTATANIDDSNVATISFADVTGDISMTAIGSADIATDGGYNRLDVNQDNLNGWTFMGEDADGKPEWYDTAIGGKVTMKSGARTSSNHGNILVADHSDIIGGVYQEAEAGKNILKLNSKMAAKTYVYTDAETGEVTVDSIEVGRIDMIAKAADKFAENQLVLNYADAKQIKMTGFDNDMKATLLAGAGSMTQIATALADGTEAANSIVVDNSGVENTNIFDGHDDITWDEPEARNAYKGLNSTTLADAESGYKYDAAKGVVWFEGGSYSADDPLVLYKADTVNADTKAQMKGAIRQTVDNGTNTIDLKSADVKNTVDQNITAGTDQSSNAFSLTGVAAKSVAVRTYDGYSVAYEGQNIVLKAGEIRSTMTGKLTQTIGTAGDNTVTATIADLADVEQTTATGDNTITGTDATFGAINQTAATGDNAITGTDATSGAVTQTTTKGGNTVDVTDATIGAVNQTTMSLGDNTITGTDATFGAINQTAATGDNAITGTDATSGAVTQTTTKGGNTVDVTDATIGAVNQTTMKGGNKITGKESTTVGDVTQKAMNIGSNYVTGSSDVVFGNVIQTAGNGKNSIYGYLADFGTATQTTVDGSNEIDVNGTTADIAQVKTVAQTTTTGNNTIDGSDAVIGDVTQTTTTGSNALSGTAAVGNASQTTTTGSNTIGIDGSVTTVAQTTAAGYNSFTMVNGTVATISQTTTDGYNAISLTDSAVTGDITLSAAHTGDASATEPRYGVNTLTLDNTTVGTADAAVAITMDADWLMPGTIGYGNNIKLENGSTVYASSITMKNGETGKVNCSIEVSDTSTLKVTGDVTVANVTVGSTFNQIMADAKGAISIDGTLELKGGTNWLLNVTLDKDGDGATNLNSKVKLTADTDEFADILNLAGGNDIDVVELYKGADLTFGGTDNNVRKIVVDLDGENKVNDTLISGIDWAHEIADWQSKGTATYSGILSKIYVGATTVLTDAAASFTYDDPTKTSGTWTYNSTTLATWTGDTLTIKMNMNIG